MTATAEQMQNRKTWLDALRSGEYKQTKQVLVETIWQGQETVDSFCCLGLACEVFGLDPYEDNQDEHGDNEEFLPPAAMIAMGLDTNNPAAWAGDVTLCATTMNDERMYNFRKIADLFEPVLLDPEYNGHALPHHRPNS